MSRSTVSKRMPGESSGRLFYIDRLKIVLTMLVIMHHVLLTYNGSHNWYYSEPGKLQCANRIMSILVSVNQSFFMGFFFFLSAYFIPESLAKLGLKQFIADKLRRLGLPLLFYAFVLSPSIQFIVDCFAKKLPVNYLDYLGVYRYINFGVLWFVAALMLFTTIYLLVVKLCEGMIPLSQRPKMLKILFAAIAVGAVSYVVRLFFPVNLVIDPFSFRPAYFTQYLFLFACGIIAARQHWLDDAYPGMERKTGLAVFIVILAGIPTSIILARLLPIDTTTGQHLKWLWQAILEQVLGFSLITFLLLRARRLWNSETEVSATLARSSYAVYVFHPLVLVGISVVLSNWHTGATFKIFVVLPLAFLLSFGLGKIITGIPGVKKIL